MKQQIQLIGLLLLACAAPAAAQASLDIFDNIESSLKKTWSHAVFYGNKENDLIQKIAFTGRLQYDLAQFDNSEGSDQYTDAWRRARAGFKIGFLGDFVFHTEMDMDFNDRDPVYNRLTDTYFLWDSGNDWQIKVGKQSAGFTLDGATSSKKLYRTERSLIASNFWFGTEYFTGISASGDEGNWQWTAGFFSGDGTPEFDKTFDASYFTLLSLGYDFASQLDADKALLRLDYAYQDEPNTREAALSGTNNQEHVVSLNYQYDNGNLHLHGDLAYGKSFRGDDLYALQIMPFYDLNKTFQVVGSYTYVGGSDAAVVNLSRYARAISGGRSEEAHEFYLGLNTFLYGHKVKWQNGIEYAQTDDSNYDGWGFTSGFRISW